MHALQPTLASMHFNSLQMKADWQHPTMPHNSAADGILVGGGNRDLFVKCDPNTWQCVGTKDRGQATTFELQGAKKSGCTDSYCHTYTWLKYPGTNLCMDILGGGCEGPINL